MQEERFDAIVVGTGQSGPPLAVRLAGAGQRVAIIERNEFGGTCVNTGCIPTKALVASARAAWVAKNAAQWGISAENVRVDMKAVHARMKAISGKSREGVESWLRGAERCTVITGHARFEGERRVRVGERVLVADRVFVDVGGRPFVPTIPGLADVPHLTSSSMMDVDFLPRRLVVLGGSYVGLEFAQMYRRFGSEVTVVEKEKRLVAREDDDVSDAIRAILEAEGVRIETAAEVVRAEQKSGPVLHLADGRTIDGSHLLVAIGRVPNTHDLGLDEAGVALDPRGYIEVDDQLRTTASGVWALGDCNGKGAFTHTSYNDYEIVAANLLDGDERRLGDRIPAYALYTDPPLGRCGMTEKEVRAGGKPALVAKMPMTRIGRARERGETQGFLKALVDAESKRILGAAFLGIEGDEVMHVVLDVMYARAPYTLITRAMHVHPTVAELIPTLLQGLAPLS